MVMGIGEESGQKISVHHKGTNRQGLQTAWRAAVSGSCVCWSRASICSTSLCGKRSTRHPIRIIAGWKDDSQPFRSNVQGETATEGGKGMTGGEKD
jgi:hypothetical protein